LVVTLIKPTDICAQDIDHFACSAQARNRESIKGFKCPRLKPFIDLKLHRLKRSLATLQSVILNLICSFYLMMKLSAGVRDELQSEWM